MPGRLVGASCRGVASKAKPEACKAWPEAEGEAWLRGAGCERKVF